MTMIQDILKDVPNGDEKATAAALKKMRKVPEHQLHFYLVLRDTLNQTASDTRRAITFAQVEYDRRAAARTDRLAIITTVLSGAVGLLGVVLGAYLKQ